MTEQESSVNPRWLTSTVVELCEQFTMVKPVFGMLPILADALEEAGCDNIRLLIMFRAKTCVRNFRGKQAERFLIDCIQCGVNYFAEEPIALICAASKPIKKGHFISSEDKGKSCCAQVDQYNTEEFSIGIALEDADKGETVILLPTKEFALEYSAVIL